MADHTRFLAAGGDLKKAKNFNNVVAHHFFNIELDMVGEKLSVQSLVYSMHTRFAYLDCT